MTADSRRGLSVLFVPSGPQRVASARLRAFQYLGPLRDAGISCTMFPATSEAIGRLRVLSPRIPRLAKPGYYLIVVLDQLSRLIPILFLAGRHDVVYIQRTTFPLGVTSILRWINPRVIFDFDDAIHLRDPADRERGLIAVMKERMKGLAVPAILRASRCAIVEHGVLEDYARLHCPRVERIPGPIDTKVFSPREAGARSRKAPFVIGWIGTPSTSTYLPIAAEALRRVATRHDIEVHLIGSGPFSFPGVRVKVFPWAENEEADRLRTFDIGIMPMPDTDWTRGKLGLKMLLYMATGIPAIVSYTPVNAEVIRNGANGFIVNDDEAWEKTIEALIADPLLRERTGQEGRKTVEKEYSLDTAVPKLLRILRDVSSDARAR